MIEMTNNNQPDSEMKFEPDSKRFKHSQIVDEIVPLSESKPFWQKMYDIECRMSAELKPIPFLCILEKVFERTETSFIH